MNYFAEAIAEGGKVSSTRIGMFTVLYGALFCLIWATIKQVPLPTLQPEWVLLVASGFGAKVWQKRYENPPTPTP